MPYDMSIPGQVMQAELMAMEAVAAMVPPGGHAVEVGALLGRSAFAWASSVPPGARVTCIDPWDGGMLIGRDDAGREVRNTVEAFRRFTARAPNIVPLRALSPSGVADWSEPVDLVFEDAVHANPTLAENLRFWSARLKPGGVFCGHDHRPRFPDVVAEAEALARRMGRELLRVQTFWCLLPPDNPATDAVRARLAAIAQAVTHAIRQMPLPAQLSLRGLPARLAPDAPLEAELVLCNIAEGRWVGPDGTALRPMLRAAPLHPAALPQAPAPHATELPPLLPDIEQRHPVILPAGAFAPGPNALAVELALLDGQGRVVRALRQDWPVEIGPAEDGGGG